MSIGGVWYRARAELRGRWHVLVMLGLLAGMIGGGAVAAAAGARRTWSAYPRFLEQHALTHASVATGGHPETDRIFAEVARLPQVERTVRSTLFLGARIIFRGATISFPDVFLLAPARYEDARDWQLKVLDGRTPSWSAPDEVFVNYSVAERLGIEPGDRMTVVLRGFDEDSPVEVREELRVVATTVTPGSFETVTGRGFPSTIGLTPAFVERHASFAASTEDLLSLALRNGEADLPALQEEIRRRGIELDGPPVPVSYYTSDVQALNRVPVVALWAGCALLGLALIGIVGQALAREIHAAGRDDSALSAIGFDRRGLVTLPLLKTLIVAVVAACSTVPIAWALSPVFPLGVARVAEPSPGFQADLTAFALGALAAFVVVLATGALPSWRNLAIARDGGDRSARRSMAVGLFARAGVPQSMLAGVRMAFAPAGRAERVPTRSAVIGAAFAVVSVVVALVFASSFSMLVGHPSLAGYTWDAAVIAEPAALDDVASSLPAELVRDSWKGTMFQLVRIDDLTLFASAGTGPSPAILAGRAPASPDEVALDPKTLSMLGKTIGERVEAADLDADAKQREMRIVGSFVVPRIPFQEAENAGQGAAFMPGGLRSIASFEYDALYVQLDPRVDPADGIQRLKERTGGIAFAVLSAQQIGAIRNIQRIAAVPWFLAGLLGAVAMATLAYTMAATAARRRRDLAILRTVGFLRSQARGVVIWQGWALVGTALLIGIPAGTAAGRVVWRLFATEIVVVPRPVAPVIGLLLIAAIAFVVVAAVSVLPARAAARTEPAIVLRSE